MTTTVPSPTSNTVGSRSTLDPEMKWLLAQTTIAADGCSARFLGTDLSVENPAQLTSMLAAQLYERCHAGITHWVPGSVPALSEDAFFEGRLASVVPHFTRTTEFNVLEDLPAQKGLVVDYSGIRTFFSTSQVLQRRRNRVRVNVACVAARLSPGFMFYTSRYGAGTSSRPLRIYRWISNGDEGVEVWKLFLSWVDEQRIPLRAKILSRENTYPRNDALVVYLPAEAWHRVPDLAALLASDHPSPGRSLFTHQLAPGVSMAWEPQDLAQRRTQLSFGEHRSQAIAKGMIAARDDRRQMSHSIWNELSAANIDPAAVHRNQDSPPIHW